jgi:hypothetical protein
MTTQPRRSMTSHAKVLPMGSDSSSCRSFRAKVWESGNPGILQLGGTCTRHPILPETRGRGCPGAAGVPPENPFKIQTPHESLQGQ